MSRGQLTSGCSNACLADLSYALYYFNGPSETRVQAKKRGRKNYSKNSNLSKRISRRTIRAIIPNMNEIVIISHTFKAFYRISQPSESVQYLC